MKTNLNKEINGLRTLQVYHAYFDRVFHNDESGKYTADPNITGELTKQIAALSDENGSDHSGVKYIGDFEKLRQVADEPIRRLDSGTHSHGC